MYSKPVVTATPSTNSGLTNPLVQYPITIVVIPAQTGFRFFQEYGITPVNLLAWTAQRRLAAATHNDVAQAAPTVPNCGTSTMFDTISARPIVLELNMMVFE